MVDTSELAAINKTIAKEVSTIIIDLEGSELAESPVFVTTNEMNREIVTIVFFMSGFYLL